MTRGRANDEGAGSIWVLGVAFVILAATSIVGLLSQVHQARETAAAAADAAALAGAHHLVEGHAVACLEAGRFALGNGALLTSCTATDEQLQVRVDVLMRGVLARLGPMKATARARLTWRD